MRTQLIVWLAAATVATASACSSSSSHTAAQRAKPTALGSTATTSSRPASSTTAASSDRSGPSVAPKAVDRGATQALRAHMVVSITGYALQPAGQSGTGPSSLAAAVNDQGGSAGPSGAAERAALTGAGYRAGYKLLFSSGDRQLLVLAYRFATPAGAQRYADRAFAARVHDGGTPSARAPTAVPGARVVDRSESDAAAALVVFTRGATLVILSTIQPANTDAAAVVDPIATEQYARLANY